MYLSKQSISIKATLATMILIVMGGFYLFSRTLAKSEGYCEEMQRFLTDEEFIQMQSIRLGIILKTGTESSASSARNFYRTHPRCCKIERRLDPICSLQSRWF